MILIGTTNLTRTRSRGNFKCPTCCVTTAYRLRARRPFLTLYFIPTVPVGPAELFVQCDECQEHWEPSVLQFSAGAASADQMNGGEDFASQTIRACVLVVIADGLISEEEITALADISQRLTGEPLSREDLGWVCSSAQQNKITAKNYVQSIAPTWTDSEKTQAVQAMFLAASADGPINAAQMQSLLMIREIMDMTEAEFQAAIESV